MDTLEAYQEMVNEILDEVKNNNQLKFKLINQLSSIYSDDKNRQELYIQEIINYIFENYTIVNYKLYKNFKCCKNLQECFNNLELIADDDSLIYINGEYTLEVYTKGTKYKEGRVFIKQ